MGDARIDPALIALQLARISGSPQFRAAGRLRDFLNYIVTETLDGREHGLKEYIIGTQVYGRNESFNPKHDSIVRVEAVKLRARLDAYYAKQGSPGELFICVPKGGYIPEFRNPARSPDQGRSCADQISELCDLGSISLMRRTPAAIAVATRSFSLARNLNPSEARAHIGLAHSLIASLSIEVVPPSAVLGELKASVIQGLRLNPNSADAHVFASLYSATAEGIGNRTTREARRALELEPRNAMGDFWASGVLSAQGTHEAGIEHMREATRNAPYCALFHAYLGRVLYYAGRNREALSVLNELAAADPTLAVGHMWTALVHSELDQHEQAVRSGQHAVALSETSATLSGNAYVLARAGRREDAELIFDRLLTAPPYGYVSPLQLGAVAEALNRPEEATAHLASARRENAWGLIWSKVDPRVKRIHSPV